MLTAAATALLFFLVVGGARASKRSSNVIAKRDSENCPQVGGIWYDRDKLIATMKVMNAIITPAFILMPTDKLVHTLCPECVSDIDGELQIDLGRLAQELGMTGKNITIWMSWELHSSWEKMCGGGGLTWFYNTEENWLSVVERPEVVTVVGWPDFVNDTGSSTHFRAPFGMIFMASITLWFIYMCWF